MRALTVEDLIREKEESVSVSYQRFILLTPKFSDSLFCFFENKDAQYYNLRIKNYYKGECQYISCLGKKKVLKTRELIGNHKEYKKYKLAFFIDRDFDVSIKSSAREIYETPCYSIENLYCSVDSLKEFLKTDLQIGEENPDHNRILDLYLRLSKEFLESSILFNAWYKLQKKKSEELNVSNNVSLDDSLIPKYIDFSLTGGVQQKYSLEDIKLNYPTSINIDNKELSNLIDEFRDKDLLMGLRGKFIFNFMTSFIRRLIEDSSNKREFLKHKIKFNMDNSLALNILNVHAFTPRCLVDFLTQYN